MRSIIIIGCYFGVLRKDTPLFLESIRLNPTIDWIIFTDCDWGYVPDNVRIEYTSFQDIRKKVQSCFDFKISLNTPYKLCDLKPAYGYIFQQYIEGYDHWGYCDFDMIFGNLRDFLTDSKLERYEKIYAMGHLSIYKNNEKVNTVFMSQKGKLNYKDVFTTDQIKVFDEYDGMYHICKAEGISQYTETEFIDVFAHLNIMMHTRDEFHISKDHPRNHKKQVFGFKDGRLYKWYLDQCGYIRIQEFAYIHFSHKEFEPLDGVKDFYITSKGIVQMNEKDNADLPFGKCPLWSCDLRMGVAEFVFRLKRKMKKIYNNIGWSL